MRSRRSDDEKLRELLRSAYRAKETTSVPDGWQQRVMATIRASSREPAVTPSPLRFSEFAWKLAPVSSLVGAVVIVLLMAMQPAAKNNALDLIHGYVQELALRHILGV
jgi:hypothetical protein